MTEQFRVVLPGLAAASVAAFFDAPERESRASAILFAHGAGVDALHPWMATVTAALVARGFTVMRFRYPYMERARNAGHPMPPDRTPALEEAHFAALEAFAARTAGKRRLLAGKSLGARIATHIAAKGATAHGLVCFGYPLHPPRQPDKLRSEHLSAIVQPALFLQGTRDEFGTPRELAPILQRFGGRATLAAVEGGDHSFEVPVAARRTQAAVLDELAERVATWERAMWPD
jgi:hypothetical protein